MSVNSLIFDLDGTLWSSIDCCVLAWNAIFEQEKIDYRIDHDEFWGLFGLNTEEIRKKVFPDLDYERGHELINLCLDEEIPFIHSHGGKLYNGVFEGIIKLSQEYKLYIVSNCHQPYLDAFLYTSKLKNYFIDTECYGNTGLSKGENIRALMVRNKITPKEAVYIGDTEGDRRAADFVKIPFIYCTFGFGDVRSSHLTINHFEELLEADFNKLF